MSHVVYVDFKKKERIRSEIDLTYEEAPAEAKAQTTAEKENFAALVEEVVFLGKGVRDGSILGLAWAIVTDDGDTNHGWLSADSTLMWVGINDLHADFGARRLEEEAPDRA